MATISSVYLRGELPKANGSGDEAPASGQKLAGQREDVGQEALRDDHGPFFSNAAVLYGPSDQGHYEHADVKQFHSVTPLDDTYVVLDYMAPLQKLIPSPSDPEVLVIADAIYGSFGDDKLRTSHASLVRGGSGNDEISALYSNAVEGGDGHDLLNVANSFKASGGDGNDRINARYVTTVYGAQGNDVIRAAYSAHVDAGSGNDVVDAVSSLYVEGGAGNDVINSLDSAIVSGGDGDDVITAFNSQYVSGGKGDDVIVAEDAADVIAGDGDDIVAANRAFYVNGGKGNDSLILKDVVFANGGEGDDLINAIDSGYVNGGGGDDVINAWNTKYIDGGGGDDIINVIGSGTTVAFGPGSGKDTVNATEDLTIDLWRLAKDTDLTMDDFEISREGNQYTISIKGSDDEMVVNLAPGAKLTLEIPNHGDVVQIELYGEDPFGEAAIEKEARSSAAMAARMLEDALKAKEEAEKDDDPSYVTYADDDGDDEHKATLGESMGYDRYRSELSSGDKMSVSDLMDNASQVHV